jgi:hypothetical protein
VAVAVADAEGVVVAAEEGVGKSGDTDARGEAVANKVPTTLPVAAPPDGEPAREGEAAPLCDAEGEEEVKPLPEALPEGEAESEAVASPPDGEPAREREAAPLCDAEGEEEIKPLPEALPEGEAESEAAPLGGVEAEEVGDPRWLGLAREDEEGKCEALDDPEAGGDSVGVAGGEPDALDERVATKERELLRERLGVTEEVGEPMTERNCKAA